MQTITTRNVTDLQPPDRQALEHLLGNSLQGNEQVFIMAYAREAKPDETARAAALERIKQVQSAVEKYAAEHGITAEEAEAAVDEAMEHVRPRDS